MSTILTLATPKSGFNIVLPTKLSPFIEQPLEDNIFTYNEGPITLVSAKTIEITPEMTKIINSANDKFVEAIYGYLKKYEKNVVNESIDYRTSPQTLPEFRYNPNIHNSTLVHIYNEGKKNRVIEPLKQNSSFQEYAERYTKWYSQVYQETRDYLFDIKPELPIVSLD